MNEAMKQAWLEISQMLGEPTREELDVFLRTWQRAMEAQKRPAQQEPTWLTGCPEDSCDCDEGTYNPPAQQELDPLAGNARDDWNDWRDDQGVYPTALNPPHRPWVGLTHEEAEEVWKRVEASDFRDVVQPFARAIEAALRSKNA